jgi:hypothetical protein
MTNTDRKIDHHLCASCRRAGRSTPGCTRRRQRAGGHHYQDIRDTACSYFPLAARKKSVSIRLNTAYLGAYYLPASRPKRCDATKHARSRGSG